MKILGALWMAFVATGLLAALLYFSRLRQYWPTATPRDKVLLWILAAVFLGLAMIAYYYDESGPIADW